MRIRPGMVVISSLSFRTPCINSSDMNGIRYIRLDVLVMFFDKLRALCHRRKVIPISNAPMYRAGRGFSGMFGFSIKITDENMVPNRKLRNKDSVVFSLVFSSQYTVHTRAADKAKSAPASETIRSDTTHTPEKLNNTASILFLSVCPLCRSGSNSAVITGHDRPKACACCAGNIE